MIKNDNETQIMIAEIIQNRIIEMGNRQEEVGLDYEPGPNAPIIVEQCNSNLII